MAAMTVKKESIIPVAMVAKAVITIIVTILRMVILHNALLRPAKAYQNYPTNVLIPELDGAITLDDEVRSRRCYRPLAVTNV